MTKPISKQQEYEKLGKMLVDLQEAGIKPTKIYYRAAFIRGMISGFGGVVGATLLVALILWLLSLFHSVPVIGNFVDTIRHSLRPSK